MNMNLDFYKNKLDLLCKLACIWNNLTYKIDTIINDTISAIQMRISDSNYNQSTTVTFQSDTRYTIWWENNNISNKWHNEGRGFDNLIKTLFSEINWFSKIEYRDDFFEEFIFMIFETTYGQVQGVKDKNQVISFIKENINEGDLNILNAITGNIVTVKL